MILEMTTYWYLYFDKKIEDKSIPRGKYMLSYSGILDLSNGSFSSGLFQLTPCPKNNDSKK